MWPKHVDWTALRFGVEFEFLDADPQAIELLPDWVMALDERQTDDLGGEGGSELKTPPITWADREQMRTMLDRLRAAGARAAWSCGLHVHVGIEPWGQDLILPMLDTALRCQQALEALFQTSRHRQMYCPNVAPAFREEFVRAPRRDALVHTGRPQSHRCGINTAAFFDIGTVEIRYPNASLDYDEVLLTVEACLRFVAAVGQGRELPGDPVRLAAMLGVPDTGYPPPTPAPRWQRERMWLEEALLPVLEPQATALAGGGEVLSIRPVPEGVLVAVELEHPVVKRFVFGCGADGRWEQVANAPSLGVAVRRAGPEEAEEVRRLLHRAHARNLANGFNFTAATISLDEMQRVMAHEETYVLEEAGELRGTVTLWSDGTLGKLGVDPEAGGRGFGARLIAFVEERAREKGWTRLELDTPVTHPWLPAFYQRHGYRPVRKVHWEGKLYDSVVMEKEL